MAQGYTLWNTKTSTTKKKNNNNKYLERGKHTNLPVNHIHFLYTPEISMTIQICYANLAIQYFLLLFGGSFTQFNLYRLKQYLN